jgi:hypothetical protein
LTADSPVTFRDSKTPASSSLASMVMTPLAYPISKEIYCFEPGEYTASFVWSLVLAGYTLRKQLDD